MALHSENGDPLVAAGSEAAPPRHASPGPGPAAAASNDSGLERKYRLTEVRAAELARLLEQQLTADIYQPGAPISYSRTSYLDDDEGTFLASHLSGGSRLRLRVREYAMARTHDEPPVLSGRCYLELKETDGARRSKHRLAAAPETIATWLDGRGLPSATPLDPEERRSWESLRVHFARPLAVRVMTWYRRRSFSDGQGLRVTLDEDICFCGPQPLGSSDAGARPAVVLHALPGCLLEVKHRRALPRWLEAPLAHLQEQPAYSKFSMAMRALARSLARGSP